MNDTEFEQTPIEKIRVIGIVAHIDAGKTTTTEHLLLWMGEIKEVGTISAKNTVTDSTVEEKAHGVTISASAVSGYYKNHKIHILDTPGHADFKTEVERSLTTIDGGVILLDGVAAVQTQTEAVYRYIVKFEVPVIAFINKMDRAGSSLSKTIEKMCTRLGCNAIPLFLPIGEGRSFSGVVDILKQKAFLFIEGKQELDEVEIPTEELKEEVAIYRHTLFELLDSNEISYDVSNLDTIQAGIRKLTIERKMVPVVCGSSLKNKAVNFLLDAIIAYLPSPIERHINVLNLNTKQYESTVDVYHKASPSSVLVRVFKIVTDAYAGTLCFAKVYAGVLRKGSVLLNVSRDIEQRMLKLVSIFADKRTELDKVSAGNIIGIVGLKETFTGDTLISKDLRYRFPQIELSVPVMESVVRILDNSQADIFNRAVAWLERDDPGIKFKIKPETGETIIMGMGSFHLQIAKERLFNLFNLKIELKDPEVIYKESPTKSVFGIRGKNIHQTGGPGRWGDVVINVETIDTPEVLIKFSVGYGILPDRFFPYIEEGMREFASNGPLSGNEIIGMKVTVVGGSFHEVDSHGEDFIEAIKFALREAFPQCEPILKEPIAEITVIVPEEYAGSVEGEIASRRGTLANSENLHNNAKEFTALMPLDEVKALQKELPSITQGRAVLTIEGGRGYRDMPMHLAKIIIEKRKVKFK